ncbi:MAG: 6-hydroxycyclohex-1-ene-1-carbonyl-CoA dehydrogenase [Gammaproteobacteria bacterium]|nr:6-hydroxycyclohex-1-ene-1-carbonyl-CoA dehydrogenase [Gammaproteobacteria bacterium]NIR84882.1 6-hydroxycyclohex-1-ene-1-carbonyl-CoA dehydrogenase [Gammaproteobacteria bacterium]NIR91731.1 6-hydroxycyclohex-1-ene-1-carbonyl-CoA dehydrogenase [Gammaproteobacteria bacterium]NIU05929.1 6-hydroxycyclohex-1-ene-1-carbonyl-CoA dehydrogenase [Gammaproteobacteria bacterium]NIV52976.1 6-hydroxycyclohex-1-ene-1-carbonyl-CoA dehydrogenase [Gammaproteobacteria bacterium]
MGHSAYRWVMHRPGLPLERTAFDPFPPGPDEVVVQVAGCGVCHTDLGYFYDGVRTNQSPPITLGHEISGPVVAAGAAAREWEGRAVIVPAVLPCGECELCRSGRPTICRHQQMPGNDADGGFATHVRVPARGLCPVDEGSLAEVDLSLADVSVVADAVTTPYQAVKRAGVAPGSLAIVVGAGGIGGYAVQIARAFGATVAAIDIDQTRLDAIAEHGAALTLNAADAGDPRELRAAVRDFAKAQALPAVGWSVLECSGTPAGQTTAWGLLTHGATLSVIGFTRDKVELRLSNLMAFDARAIGNWGCPPELYPGALDLVLEGKVQVAPFVEHHPLSEINTVFEAVHAGRCRRRPVLIPD